MACACVIIFSPRDYDAVFFDLDDVLTRSVNVQAAASKNLFDRYLEQHSALTNEVPFRFDLDTDCRRYVDGKVLKFIGGIARVFRLNDVLTDERFSEKGPVDERARHHAHPHCHNAVRQEAAESRRAQHRPSNQRCPVGA